MQEIRRDGSLGPIEPYDPERLKTLLGNPDVAEVRVFRASGPDQIKKMNQKMKRRAKRKRAKASQRKNRG